MIRKIDVLILRCKNVSFADDDHTLWCGRLNCLGYHRLWHCLPSVPKRSYRLWSPFKFLKLPFAFKISSWEPFFALKIFCGTSNNFCWDPWIFTQTPPRISSVRTYVMANRFSNFTIFSSKIAKIVENSYTKTLFTRDVSEANYDRMILLIFVREKVTSSNVHRVLFNRQLLLHFEWWNSLKRVFSIPSI